MNDAPLPRCTPAPDCVREVVVAEWSSKKICHCLVSTSASSEHRVWADLPDNLLHLIIALLSSFHDLLAFTGTCHSWRAAVFSFPSSIYAFVFPPLHLKAGLRRANWHCNTSYNLLSNYKWHLCDLVRTNLSLRRSAPRNTPNYMRYLGCSYGHLIFSCVEHLLLVDVYTDVCHRLSPDAENHILGTSAQRAGSRCCVGRGHCCWLEL
uniref:F-box domain-containing protein n=1 Tax=Aegilops tauschii subsp. strangulata TaxID=200361 RepID=A0A453AWL7_AEGTS